MEPRPEQEAAPSRLSVNAEDAGIRADAWLFRELPRVSRTRMRQKIQMGDALLNGHRFSTATRLRAGDEVRIWWRSDLPRGSLLELAVVHDDDWLLAVDKPAGVACHPVGARRDSTVIQAVRERYAERIREELRRGATSFYPTLVNRLDVFTSGIVLIALTRESHRSMQAMSAARLIEKEYVALVEGAVDGEQGLIELPIGPASESRVALKRACRPDGKPSTTRWEVMERYAAHTLLRLFPVTGRQHQLRVHLSAIGHPIVGDRLYKDESLFLSNPRGRHCLHARRVKFRHPQGGQQVAIEADLPEDFLAILRTVSSRSS